MLDYSIYIDDVLKNLEYLKETKYSKIYGKSAEEIQENLKKEVEENENLDKSNIEEKPAFEEIINKHRKFKLVGHSDSIFGISISNDKKFLLSCSFDETIRLWSIYTRSAFVVYKGHFSPVLCVKFSSFKYFYTTNLSHYFASGGSDKTAKFWGMNSPSPLRVFVGHLSDVEVSIVFLKYFP